MDQPNLAMQKQLDPNAQDVSRFVRRRGRPVNRKDVCRVRCVLDSCPYTDHHFRQMGVQILPR